MNLFLIGAGFNVDAGSHRGEKGTRIAYPLVNDVARLCFDLEPGAIPTGKSIENLFDEALKRSDYQPLERLSERLMECDWRLATSLENTPGENDYRRFLSTSLNESNDRRLIIVSPTAHQLVEKLKTRHPSLEIVPVVKTFSAWAEADFLCTL